MVALVAPARMFVSGPGLTGRKNKISDNVA